jgi:fructokinase
LVVVTRGGRGTLAWHESAGFIEVGAPAVEVVDTIGAGDTFQGALLFALREIGRIRIADLASLSHDELERVLRFAMACAAITVGRVGADPPCRADLGAQLIASLLGQGGGPPGHDRH